MAMTFNKDIARKRMAVVLRALNNNHAKIVKPSVCGYAQNMATFPIKHDLMLPKGTFDGRTALVTGGGTGIGAGIAHALSYLGANVVITSRKLDVLQATAKKINEDTGNTVTPISCDVRNTGEVKNMVDTCIATAGLPTLIVNNAAGNFISPSERLSNNAWNTIIDIVLNGTANIILETGKRLIAAGKGATYLAITTAYTQHGSAFVAPSSAAKSGVETLHKSLAAEWGKYGMRFNCLAPGAVETKGAFSRLDPTGKFIKILVDRTPVGRMGEINEISNLATYLLSDYSSFVSAETVVIDGGELTGCAGQFNELRRVTKEEWDMLEQMIRQTKGS